MDGLSNASAAFAVISLAVQLAESVKKLVEFWKAIEDAPGDIDELFTELELLSALLVRSQRKFARNSPYDLIAKRIFIECQKRIDNLHSKLSPTMLAFTSSSSRKRKWAALKVTLRNDEIKKMRTSVGEALLAVQMIQQDAILNMVEMVLHHQEETSKGSSAIQQSVVQYSQDLKPMDKVKSLPLSYDSDMLLGTGNTTVPELPDSRENQSREYCEYFQTNINAMTATHKRMAIQTNPSVALEKALSSIDDTKQQVIDHTLSRFTSWKAVGETPIFSYRVSSASSKSIRVYGSSSQETVTKRIKIVFYPANWLYYLGVSVGIRMSATVDNGWMFTFSSFGAVPEDALIFDLCRHGNVAGVKILLDRGDAAIECENPQGETPLSTAVHYGQVDVARFLIAAGAKNSVNEEPWRNAVVLDARLKIALIETLQVYYKDKNSKYGTIGRLAIFYESHRRIEMSFEDISNNMLWVFKALTPSLRTGHLAQMQYAQDMIINGYQGRLIHWLISRIEGNIEIYESDGKSHSLLHLVVGARFLHRDPLSVKMIMEKTSDLHIRHGYGSWGRYQPQTPTVIAMHDQDLFISWQQLLEDSKQDIDLFIEREIASNSVALMGWTKETLRSLFKHRFQTPSHKGRRTIDGFPECDRCKHISVSIGMSRLKIDLEFRRQLREIRTGRTRRPAYSHNTNAGVSSLLSSSVDKVGELDTVCQEKSWSLPYRFVCSDKCRDGISVHDVFENEMEDLPKFPPYISKEEKERLERSSLAEEEASCPTYTMPGAF